MADVWQQRQGVVGLRGLQVVLADGGGEPGREGFRVPQMPGVGQGIAPKAREKDFEWRERSAC